jgi:DNA-binding beta-propeller fold protein YncE
MKPSIALSLGLFILSGAAAEAQQASPLRLVQTIPLENVEGRIDHFGIDPEGQRLFMSALGNNTVEVFDLRAGKRIHTISGLHEPQGACFTQVVNKLFVANGEGGAVNVYDGESYKLVKEVKFSDDADNVRYDPRLRKIYVGYGEGALGVLDAATSKQLGDIALAAHPESFQLEKTGRRIFVNVPNAQMIAVIDREKQAVIAKWPMGGNHANFPMALDESDRRLLVACRKPPEVRVFDTETGQLVVKVPCAGDADDMWYDAAHKRIYVSGGEGVISVIEQQDVNHYREVAKVPTAAGSRTSFFAPGLHHLYLAVPHRGNQRAELRVYDTQP